MSIIKISFSRETPDQDEHEREVCDHCGFVYYQNPKVVVGAVATYEGRFLMCRRAIDPGRGLWTIPAGFMELNETCEQAAQREAREEANAVIVLDGVLAIYTLQHISQVQIFYRARLVEPTISPGVESLEVGLYAWDDIPWAEIAFPSVHWVLHHYREALQKNQAVPFGNPETP